MHFVSSVPHVCRRQYVAGAHLSTLGKSVRELVGARILWHIRLAY